MRSDELKAAIEDISKQLKRPRLSNLERIFLHGDRQDLRELLEQELEHEITEAVEALQQP